MKEVSERTNSVMSRLLSTAQPRTSLISELADALAAGIVEKNGCVLLRAFENSAGEFDPRAHFDRTGYECLVNHVHFDANGPATPLARALTYTDKLVDLLCTNDAARPCRIIVGAKPDGSSCTVRFHRTRSGESWLDDDLEAYDDGLLVIDC